MKNYLEKYFVEIRETWGLVTALRLLGQWTGLGFMAYYLVYYVSVGGL
ncbi:MAG: hypothetical protein WCX59_04710 [Anaerovoracaceae bacterium]